MATVEGVRTALKLLVGAIPGAKLGENTAEAWLTLFAEVGDEQLLRAAKDVAVKATYFPVPRELLAAVREHQADPPPGGLRGAARRLEDAAYAGRFDPEEWEELAQAFDKADRQYGAERIRAKAKIVAALEETPCTA